MLSGNEVLILSGLLLLSCLLILGVLIFFLVRTRGRESVHAPWGTGVDLEPGEGEAGAPLPPRPGVNVEDVTDVEDDDLVED
jgi:hypothetical protein